MTGTPAANAAMRQIKPAFAVWVWLLAAYGRLLVRSYRSAAGPDWFARGLLLGASGGLVGFVLTGFLQYNFGDAEAMVIFYFVMGMTFALQRLDASLLPAAPMRV